MAVCARCGKEYDPSDAELEFYDEIFGLNYDNFSVCLCGACAIEAIRDGEDGVYYETCEQCGNKFDLAVAKMQYNDRHPWFNGTDLPDIWRSADSILCADCALEWEEDNL